MKLLLSFFLLGLTFVSCSSEVKEETNTNWTIEEFKANVEDGDVILKMGFGQVSKIISKQLSENIPLSHCAIVYKKNDGFYMIHSVSGSISDEDGVQISTVDKFYEDIKPNSLFVLRHKSEDSSRSKISSEAKKILKKKVPFDLEFNKDNSDKLYCS